MSLASLLDSITNRQESRKRSKWSDYKSLVAAICDGKEPSADVVAQTLADNETTLDGLRHDVLLIIRRHALASDFSVQSCSSSAATRQRAVSVQHKPIR